MTGVTTGIGQDFRYAMRQLRKSPGFLAVVVFSLALGIGANSTIFSVLNAVLYRPMPYDHPERLVAIWETQVQKPEDGGQPHRIAEVNDWKRKNHIFQDIALTSSTERSTLSGLGEAEPITVQDVTPNFFSLLGAKPVLGRIFAADEMQDTTQTVVIGNSFWKRKFNGDPNALGKTFTIQGVVSTVVGVMPAGFAPFYGERIDMWQPINPESSRYVERIDHWLMPVARLKPDVTLAQAQVEMDVIARRLEQAYPKTNKGIGKKLVPLHQELIDWAGKSLYPLFGAVFFVLLIACVNVANLLQSRTEVRRKEYALRAALGSGRRRLIQQLLAESGLLALLGGGLGIVISFAGIELFRKLAGEFPNSGDIRVDAQVLLFTLGVSMLTALLFGLAPAIQASRPDLNLALREGEGRTSTASRGWVRHSLAVSEVALAMLLLVGAGLMINTMLRLHQIDPGFDPKNVTTMSIPLPEGGKYLVRVSDGNMERTLTLITAFCKRAL
jgi:putative ABC transport system permease protein